MSFLLRAIFLILCGSFIFSADSVLASKGHIPIRSDRTLLQEVETHSELLQKKIAMSKNKKEKFSVLSSVLGQIQMLRENSPPQNASDEARINLMVSVLESLPRKSEFKKQDCAKYEEALINQFEPGADEEPQEPAVQPGWRVLKALCD